MVTEDKSRVYLRSLLFDLGKYEGVKVRITGNYFQEEISGSPVDLLVVNSVDLLEDVDLSEEDVKEYRSTKLGLELEYDASSLDIDESGTRLLLTSRDYPGSIVFKLYKETPELDLKLFMDENYDNTEFESRTIGGKKYETNSSNFNDKLIYFIKSGSYFYEISVVGFSELTDSEKSTELEELLAKVKYITVDNDFFKDNSKVEDEISEKKPETAPETAKTVQVNSEFQSTINSFKKVEASILTGYASTKSYSFADVNNFYVIYTDKDEKTKRAQIRNNSGNFEVVGKFESGNEVDWVLTDGKNTLFDKQLTLVQVGEEGNARSVEILKGYRYFESLPLEFGMQYPQSWYYSRSDDTYLFSDKPISEGVPKIKAEFIDEPFDSFSGSTVEAGIKKSTSSNAITLYVKLDDNTLKITGGSNLESILMDMAKSTVLLDN
jgi:hypothetical protein